MEEETKQQEEQEHTQPQQPTKLSPEDALVLKTSKFNKQLAHLAAEKAMAQNESADIRYKYIVLQLFMKYNLTGEDSIDDDGNITKGGATT